MRHHAQLHRIGQYIGNAGYLIGILEYGVTDIVLLRFFAITGCGMVVVYQLCQPRVQWISAGWCAVYSCVNVYQLLRLRWSTGQVSLTWEEERLYNLYASHMTKPQFFSVISLGSWQWLVDGALLADDDEPAGGEGSRLTFIIEGRCEVRSGGRVLAELGPGSLVGEMGLLTDCTPTSANVAAVGPVRCCSVPAQRLLELLEEQPELRLPLESIFASALAAKVSAMNNQAKVRNYHAVLEVACTLDEHDGVDVGVVEYRRRHAISDALHASLIEEIPQCIHRPFMTALVALDPETTCGDIGASNAISPATDAAFIGSDA